MMVYRIARHDDPMCGPYNFEDYNSNPLIMTMCTVHASTTVAEHLDPAMDSALGAIQVDEYCGLDSMENLNNWFLGFLTGLGKAGFMLYAYEAPVYRVGKNGQVVFPIHLAKLIETREIS